MSARRRKCTLSHVSNTAEKKPLYKPLAVTFFLVGSLVILASSYLQYVIPGLTIISATLIVYGIPIIVTGVIRGRVIIANALNQTYNALKYGLGYFGAFTVLGILINILIIVLLSGYDPTAVNRLNQPNPVLQVSPELAWFMMAFSFVVVGPCEEYLFRGFVFGGLLSIFKNKHWLSLALLSSIFFAIVHLYYAFTYEIASLVPFADLTTFGMAMAATYYVSNGNLFIPAMIHGAYDATAFLSVATSSDIGVQLRELLILVGIIVAIAVFWQGKRVKQVFQCKAKALDQREQVIKKQLRMIPNALGYLRNRTFTSSKV